MSRGKPFLSQLKNAVVPVLVHGVGMATAIVCLWIIELLLRATMGENALFFGTIPVAYVIQLGDILILAKFVRVAWKDFNDA